MIRPELDTVSATGERIWSFSDDEEMPPHCGQNPPDGATLHYYLSPEIAQGEPALAIEILDAAGRVVRSFRRGEDGEAPPCEPGLNRLVWNLRRTEVTAVPGLLRLPRTGYRMAPGTYQVRLTLGEEVRFPCNG